MIRLSPVRCLIASMLLGMLAAPISAVEKQTLLLENHNREFVHEFRLLVSHAKQVLSKRSNDRVNVYVIPEQAGFRAARLCKWIFETAASTTLYR